MSDDSKDEGLGSRKGANRLKTIQLTKGFAAMVDDTDFERISKLSWRVSANKPGFYAQTNVRRGSRQHTLMMHQFIMGPGSDIDHRDGNGLNNQRNNLRRCNDSQNQGNRKKGANRLSRWKGVTLHSGGKWQAQIKHEGKSRYLGLFVQEWDAAEAYNQVARQLFGEFARLNVRYDPTHLTTTA